MYSPSLLYHSCISSVQNCGMNFAWSLFEFTMADCQLLAKALKATPTLKVLRLTQSKATDERGRLLVAHLLDHPSLHTLGKRTSTLNTAGIPQLMIHVHVHVKYHKAAISMHMEKFANHQNGPLNCIIITAIHIIFMQLTLNLHN